VRDVPVDNGRRSALPRAAVALLAVFLLVAGAQALVAPAGDVAAADGVVRGTLSGVASRWNDDRTHIVTTATVDVAAWLKGSGPSTVTVAVFGGTAGGITEMAAGEPVLVGGTEAYLFLRKGADQGLPTDARVLRALSVHGGKVPGGSKERDAGIPVADFDAYLAALARGEDAALPAVAAPPLTRAVPGDPPVILSVSPDTASAGTGTEITIAGTGFGAKTARDSRADVGFLSRYDGSNWTPIWASGAYYYDRNENDIVSWTDTKIVVRVPAGITAEDIRASASSGFVFVVPEDGRDASSSVPFTVTFGYGKARWNGTAPYLVNPGAIAGAAEAVQRASATWNAAVPTSGFRFEYLGTSNATTFGRDGTNLVSFHPESFFGTPSTYRYYGASYVWTDNDGTILEADIALNEDISWSTGTATGDQMNLETAALHLLGNWLSLSNLYGYYPGMPSDMGEAMFFRNGPSIGNQNLVTLGADDAEGIRWIYPARLTVTSLTPSSGYPGTTVSVTNLAGTAFEAGATVLLSRTGSPDIPATNVVVSSPTKIACKFPLPADAATGTWNVTVTNPGGESATLENGFLVNPRVTSIVPKRGAQNSTVAFTLAGAGFEPDATVQLTRTGSEPIVATEIAWVSPGQLNGTFAIPLEAATGSWNVVVTNPSGSSASKVNGFTVDPAITVLSVTPKTGVRGTTVAVVVAGTGFLPGATFHLYRSGQPEIPAREIVAVSGEELAGSLVLPIDAVTGSYYVVVTNPDGSWARKANIFTITLPPIALVSIDPTSGVAGTTVPFTIAGAEFVAGSTSVTLTRPGSATITATGAAAVSTGEITGSFVLPETATLGPWHVNVTNSGRRASFPDGFAILPATLTVTSIVPTNATRGETVAVAVTGSGFADGATLHLQKGSATIYATGVAVASPTGLAGTLAIPATAATGTWNVVVTNPGGQKGTLLNGFTVNPGLAVTSISPNSGVRGTSLSVTVAGTGFEPGATVHLFRAGEPEIWVGSVTVASPTKITGSLAIPADAALGTWDVVVTNPGGRSASKLAAFTVKDPAVTVTSITPNSGLRNTTVPVVVGGTSFADGATVTLTKSGQPSIGAVDVVVVSAAQIACTLDLPADAAYGPWSVVVANPDGRKGTLSNGFTVTLPPITVTAIDPGTGTQGASVPVTVTGTEFVTGTTSVKLSRAGASSITATTVLVSPGTEITCTFNLPATAPPGLWNVDVTNAGRSATLPNGFTVLPPFAVTAIQPNTGIRGTTVAVVVSGTLFEPSDAVTLVRDGSADIPATGVVLKSPTEITCSFALPATLEPGAFNVVVSKPGNITATLPAGFAVFDRPPPPPVTDLRVTARTTTSLAWNWTDPVGEDFVKVRVYLDNRELADVPAGTRQFGLAGLEPGTAYVFSTRAYDDVGNPSTWANLTSRTLAEGVVAVPGGVGVPTDPDDLGLYADVNGNGRLDFADVVLFFNQMT